MARILKLWNGRANPTCRKYSDSRWPEEHHRNVHGYVCAYSRADARRVIEQYCGRLPPDSELKNYWVEGAWGREMEGVTPERGLWLQFDRSQPPAKVA